MKIALAQMRVTPGMPDVNFDRMRRFISSAKRRGCSIIAFPEMCVGGYLLGDLWLDEAFCGYLMEFNDRVRSLSEGILVLFGNVFLDRANVNKDGRVRKFNAAYAYCDAKPLPNTNGLPDGIAFKSLLPNYRIFDDERYFFSLQELSADLGAPISSLLRPFEATIGGRRIAIGLEICEDLWFNDYRCNRRPLNVTRILIENGAHMLFNLSSSPWTYKKGEARNNRIRDAYNDCAAFVPFFYVNCVGVQNNGKNIVTFDGDSTVYNEKAEVAASASRPYGEELLVYDTAAKTAPVVKRRPDGIEGKYLAAVEGIRGMDEMRGSSGFPYIVGMSGGVDSSVVACLVERAVGRSRLLACTLPSRYNSGQTKRYAAHVAQKLGVTLHTIPIEGLVAENERALASFCPQELHRENIQAKIRGTAILSNIAGITGGVMTNNGNKVEIALGYATLYGDVCGAIAPIGDCLKTEVFALARYLNEKIYRDEVVPRGLLPDERYRFEVPPSAELKPCQVDPMKWGYHDRLLFALTDYRRKNPETILEWFLSGTLCENLDVDEHVFDSYGLRDPETFIADLEWFVASMQSAVFKRIQAPPIIIMSKGCFGYDIRESQLPLQFTERYRTLREKALKGARQPS